MSTKAAAVLRQARGSRDAAPAADAPAILAGDGAPLRSTPVSAWRSAGAAADPQLVATAVMSVLPRAMDLIRQTMRRQLDSPLTVPQFRALNFIEREPGCSVSAVAAFLGVSMATASAMADRLVRAGHLRSQGSRSDRRCSELRVEPNGQAVLARMRAQTRHELAQALQRQPAESLDALLRGLQVLDDSFPRAERP